MEAARAQSRRWVCHQLAKTCGNLPMNLSLGRNRQNEAEWSKVTTGFVPKQIH